MLGTLFRFFLGIQMRNRKTLLVLIAAAVPVVIALLTAGLETVLSEAGVEVPFSAFSFALYVHFLVPLIALFLGVGVIADEVEDGTLLYLLTRPVPRFLVVLGKMMSGFFIGSLALLVSLAASYSIISFASPGTSLLSGAPDLLRGAGVLVAEFLAYGAIFSLAGGTVRHPMVLGLLFVFGWEKIIAYVPGSARYLTVMNYVQTLYPDVPSPVGASFLDIQGSIPDATAIVVLSAVFLLAGGFACTLLSLKEYR